MSVREDVFEEQLVIYLQRRLDEMDEQDVPLEDVEAFLAEYGYYKVNG